MDLLFDGPADAPLTVALAHGAGAAMDSPFMAHIAAGLGGRGWRVVRFEFPYMAARREDGRRRGPDRAPVMLDTWRKVLEDMAPDRTVIGGKSMGGRMASMIADEAGARGLVCLGYPFHPPGRPENRRVEHLAELRTPTLICQGERDALGALDEIAAYDLSPAIRFFWLPDGDHSFKPRQRSGHSEADNLQQSVGAIDSFLTALADASD